MSADLEIPSTPDDVRAGSDDQPANALDDQVVARASEVPQWTFLLLSLVVILLSFVMSAPGEQTVYLPGTSVPLPGLCVTRSIMGIDCPGCGLTRCFISLAHGQFERAWHFNPAGFLFYAVVAIQVPFRLVQIFRIRTGRSGISSPVFSWVIGAVGVSLVLQWAVKIWIELTT